MSTRVTENAATPKIDGTPALAEFVANLRFEDIPLAAVERTKNLFADWVGCALAGKDAPQVVALEHFASLMGPRDGTSEILVSRARTSPLFAALVNGGSSHVVEQDDVHNSSVVHLGTVVFPAVLAAAQHSGASGRELITAAVAGYEVGARVGEFLGRSHYKVFHTTGTAGTLAAAAGVARVLGLDSEATLHALGSAGTQAAGLWEFLRDAGDSKQLHTAKAASDGLLAAYLARDGFTGARHILEGPQGMAAGMSSDADTTRLTAGLGNDWAVLDTSFKVHASCRHTHPSADALQLLLRKESISPAEIVSVRAHVYHAALDVLGPAESALTVHQSKFSMGFVLALIAIRGQASLLDFTEEALDNEALRAFQRRVEMVYDAEIEAAYPAKWIGYVEIETVDGRRIAEHVETPKGDPGNSLSRAEIAEKVLRLAAYRQAATAKEIRRFLDRAWSLDSQRNVQELFADPPRDSA